MADSQFCGGNEIWMVIKLFVTMNPDGIELGITNERVLCATGMFEPTESQN